MPGLIEIPIFPLPNVVFFPRTILPLHIFEPRYRTMVAEALEGNRRIGMVLLRQGPETDEMGDPLIHQIGGLGQINEFHRREDGKFDIILSGLSRFRIAELLPTEPYHKARVELLADRYEERTGDHDFALKLITHYRRLTGQEEMEAEEMSVLEKADLPTLVNSVCSALQISPQDKQVLLEMDEVRSRAEAISAVLSQLLSHKEFVDQFAHLRPEEPGVN